MELIKGNLNALGCFKGFQVEMQSLPPDIKKRLQSYVNSLDIHNGKVKTADIQIIISGLVKVDSLD